LPTLYEHYTSGGISAGLSADQPYFTLNNKNITLYSGALHYFRVPQEYWRDRMRKMRAAGLNTVETYVPWNLHEPEPGVYDFGDGGTDFQDLLHVEKFLKMAQEEDLFAIVRPGPYICSEWEFGGLPSWLLREKGIQVRTSDQIFMDAVRRFFNALFPILVGLQFKLGGPIIAFQIENEYGYVHNKDLSYLEGLKQMFLDNGLNELLVTSDLPTAGNDGQIPGVLYTANFNFDPEEQLNVMQTYQPGKPSMVMEYWSGWFDHWTETHHTVTTEHFADLYERILKFPSSVNLYMFHGGTSFGFMNGANIEGTSTDNAGFQPDTSSYDYDAPLSEAGDYTGKYYAFQSLIEQYTDVQLLHPEAPAETTKGAYPNVSITESLSLQNLIEQSIIIESETLMPMELLPINNNAGQSYGYIVYRKVLDIPAGSTLKIGGRVCDTVMVLINGVLKSKVTESQLDLNGFGYWRLKDSTLNLGAEEYTGATLDLVVANWGRNNFGSLDQMVQYKGLWQGNVSINNDNISNWQIIPLEFKKNWINSLTGWQTPANLITGPTLYKGTFEVSESVDTFIDMSNWKQGFVAINGFVISRHFSLGPQQTAFLPAPFVKPGVNEIVIFEHFIPQNEITFSPTPIYKTITP